ncbi:zinc finger CCHC domain-containing protein 4-like isoform X2 [Mizuhopecten yessoensis]|uniref:zinc finger CCHC domain-containing protein 4-like isoform X2 n=1 Tax=Mizuhopecten yessoensis TaxID=6573 RepID=UPI000B45EC3F|nr:zinc finger CCHC domain-containing protein 4-like isoform X2 [Mizuhopecten yessoensis]
MAANTAANVDVIIDTGGREIPECPHGPALLFVKYDRGSSSKFFACSAFRDRKECNFFQWESEKPSEEKKKIRQEINSQQKPKFSHEEAYNRFLRFKEQTSCNRELCQTCGRFLLPGELKDHKGHKVKSPITDEMLEKPTKLFVPLDNNKTFAQYLFSASAVDFTIKTLEDLSFTHIVCVGAPRIFEAIELKKDSATKGLLLDLDHRYQLYPTTKFCRYNMFNHHFFDGQKSEDVFKQFILEEEEDGKRVAMVMDPPFGGMVDALAATYNKISLQWQTLSDQTQDSNLPILWFFPYFMEKRIKECLPTTHMLDYKVDYDNHMLFRGDMKKQGSPVRIFTNLSPERVILPASDGYWFCKVCSRFSAKENLHCDVCDLCPSKDGRTYKHCFKCDRCVKPSKQHCKTCKTCQQQDHRCGQPMSNGCHVCGALDHKRRNCPKQGSSSTKRGAPENSSPNRQKRKRKK